MIFHAIQTILSVIFLSGCIAFTSAHWDHMSIGGTLAALAFVFLAATLVSISLMELYDDVKEGGEL